MRKRKISHKKATRRRSSSGPFFIVTYRRIIIPTLLLVVGAGIAFSGPSPIKQSVLGTNIARPLFAQAVIKLPSIAGAQSYNIYYKAQGDPDFKNAVRNVGANVTDYLVSYLKKNIIYYYKIAAKSPSGKEFWWSETKQMSNIQSM